MRLLIRLAVTAMLLPALVPAAVALETTPMPAVRADRWAEAQAIAARFADPVAEKLVLYMRLRSPGAATALEIADFMRRNPDWPAQAMLERRREEAIATDPDDAAVLAQCGPDATPASPAIPVLAAALLRCAEATANAGHTEAANALARKAWVGVIDDSQTEAAFLRRWGGIATPGDQWARFERLAWSNDQAAARQIGRLDPAHQKAADARMAAKRGEPQAEALVAALPPGLRDDPGLAYDRARALRQAGALEQAASVLGSATFAGHEAAFWVQRNLLARALIAAGDTKTAYRVAAENGQTGDEQKADAEFLAGFIALRRLHDPALALPHFQALARSTSAITQGRAHYWLARTDAAAGRDPRPEYRKAAAWPTTFYGQLAALALGENPAERLKTVADPVWTPETAQAFTGHEVLRAAAWLIAWGEHERARIFLLRVDELSPNPAERALVAAFALRAGVPDSAVFVARRMGRDGIALPRMGWPSPFTPPAPPDQAFSLGIMRQESSFDIGAVSPSGARGLMQLMPATAQSVARQLGTPVSLPGLTEDAAQNMRLGTAYLQEVLTHFDDCLPLAAAAYNAGPGRVGQWLAQNGDPRVGPIDMVDWIELIPVGETRNYVQRVIENVTIYRAQRNDPAPILKNTPWTR
jgi:soluble lytic murein transglycosylase